MKTFYALLIFAVLFHACSESGQTGEKTSTENNTIDEALIDLILNHYEVNPKDSAWHIRRDSLVLIAEYHDPAFAEEEFMDLEMMRQISIPLLKSAYITGDLTGDGVAEIVYEHIEMGISGPAVQDILTISGSSGNYQLMSSAAAYMLSQCPEEGVFSPEKIENGKLFGHSDCFTENDPRCCPSLHYSVILEWKDGAYETVEMTETTSR